jgi:hypothetical protein
VVVAVAVVSHPHVSRSITPLSRSLTYRYAWGDGQTDQLPTVLDSNLFVANYFAVRVHHHHLFSHVVVQFTS